MVGIIWMRKRVFTVDLMIHCIANADLSTIEFVKTKYCCHMSHAACLKYLEAAIKRGEFLIFDFVLRATNLDIGSESLATRNLPIIHWCVTNSLQHNDCTIIERQEIIKKVLKANPFLVKVRSRSLDSYGFPIFCRNVHPVLLTVLAKHSDDILLEDRWGRTFLHYAAEKLSTADFEKLMHLLFEEGKSTGKIKTAVEILVSHASKIGKTPLHTFLNRHQVSVKATLNAFKKMGANFNSESIYNTIMGSCNYNIECLKEVFNINGGLENIRKLNQFYLLHMAVVSGNCNAGKFLIESGWNVNEPNKDGLLPLDVLGTEPYIRFHDEKYKLVQLLLMNPNVQVESEKSLAYILLKCVEHEDTANIKKLLERGANLSSAFAASQDGVYTFFDAVFGSKCNTLEMGNLSLNKTRNVRIMARRPSLEKVLTGNGAISLELWNLMDSFGLIGPEEASMFLMHLIHTSNVLDESQYSLIYSKLIDRGADTHYRFENGQSVFNWYVQSVFSFGYMQSNLPQFVKNGYDIFEENGKFYLVHILQIANS